MMERKKKFLIRITKAYYEQGDSYFADFNEKKKRWNFGYTNDYPLQHGASESFSLPDKMIDILTCKCKSFKVVDRKFQCKVCGKSKNKIEA